MTINTETRPVALAGRIPVKVNLEGGAIRVGDLITISSVPGIGKKAVSAGKVIGHALENYDGPTEENGGKVLIFASLGNYQTETESASSSLLGQVIDVVKSWLGSMQVFIENGLVRLKELIADKATVNQLCVGNTCVTETQLKELLEKNQINPSTSSPTDSTDTTSTIDGEQQTTGSEEAPPTTPDTTPPTITLNGPSAIELEKGTNWSDPGATVTDNVNDNLGIYYKINNEPTGNEGRDLPNIDTNIPGTYIITYTATDQAGNTTEVTRTVNVNEPTSFETSSSTPETQG